jgi:DinB family protein
MAQQTTPTPSYSAATTKTPKARFLDAFERELATTHKVLRALPADKSGFRPHERSNTAFALGWTFVVEGRLLLKGLRHEEVLGGGFGTPPESWEDVLAEFDKTRDDVLVHLRDATNPNLEGSVTFFTGPKQMGKYSLDDFAWFMLHDHIHHRGQLSVYVRMTGGKVPSIYGPSADEPWH